MAAFLVALAASPFTAPFATLAPGELAGEMAPHAYDDSAKTLKDVADLDLFWSIPSLSHEVPASLVCTSVQVAPGLTGVVRPLVLRI